MKRESRNRIAILLVLVLVTSCGRGPIDTPLPASSQKQSNESKSKLVLRITIPRHRHRPRGSIHPRYISPATKSIALAFTPPVGSPLTFASNLTPETNPACKASLISPIVCTLSVGIGAGTYTATFATFDGLLDNAGVPTGNILSRR